MSNQESENLNRLKDYNKTQSTTSVITGDTQPINALNEQLDSPDDDYDDSVELSVDSLEYHETSIISDSVTSSPVFQKRFDDIKKLKTYPSARVTKNRLGRSKISCSPKRSKRIIAKFSSPSDIPSREATLIAMDENPGSLAMFSKTMTSYNSELVWKNLTKDVNFSSKIETSTQVHTGSKYSHLRHQDKRCKKLSSPTAKDSIYSEDIVDKKKRSAVMWPDLEPEDTPEYILPITRSKAPEDRNSKLKAIERTRLLKERYTSDSENHSCENLKGRNGTRNLSQYKFISTTSKPKVVSVKIIKKAKKY